MENVETSIPARFESIARLHPERLAVKDGGQSLTYDQLNRAANLIAHAVLSQRGATSEPIPLLFQHGIDMFPAILGVLKAGKFYLGLDPSLPDERQARMLADSGASLLLSNSRGERLANPKLRRSMGRTRRVSCILQDRQERPRVSYAPTRISCLTASSTAG